MNLFRMFKIRVHVYKYIYLYIFIMKNCVGILKKWSRYSYWQSMRVAGAKYEVIQRTIQRDRMIFLLVKMNEYLIIIPSAVGCTAVYLHDSTQLFVSIQCSHCIGYNQKILPYIHVNEGRSNCARHGNYVKTKWTHWKHWWFFSAPSLQPFSSFPRSFFAQQSVP